MGRRRGRCSVKSGSAPIGFVAVDMWNAGKGSSLCLGKYHNIEVEDEVTAYVEYDNGATGVFITSTAMTPETNRLEVMGERGKVVIEHGQMIFYRNRVPERQFNREYRGGFGSPECWKCEIPVSPGPGGQHREIMQNFVDAILKGTKLLAPGLEGIHGLQISNAMYLSSWIDDWVEIPVDENLFYENLKERIDTSTYKKEAANSVLDVTGTY